MKHDKYELTYKKFIKAEKRLNEIYKLLRKSPKVQLKEPYQKGWIFTIVLRDDYARSNNGLIVAPLLKDLVKDIFVNNPKHVSETRKKPALNDVRRYLDRTERYIYSPYIRVINQQYYDKLSPQQRKFFTLDGYESSQNRWGGKQNFYYLDIPSHYLVVKITKRMITHVSEIDTDLLKEQDELRKILAPYWRTCGRYSGDYYYFEKKAERKQSKINLTKLELE